MRKIIILVLVGYCYISAIQARTTLTLDSCRNMALRNNKSLLIAEDEAEAAYHENKAAQTLYLPRLNAAGSYIYNLRTTQLLSKSQKAHLNNLGTDNAATIQSTATSIVQQYPDLGPLVQSLGTQIVPTLNQVGNSIVDAFQTNTHNIFGAGLILTQPIYMGGRIKAYNNITHYAQELFGEKCNQVWQQVILDTDQAYWQVVSLTSKEKLAQSYLKTLETLSKNVQRMFEEGLVTRANTLTVNVKLNEAQMALTKVENGLSLSKMLLCQLCGLPINEDIAVADADICDKCPSAQPKLPSSTDVNLALINRPELKMLDTSRKLAEEQVNLARTANRPTIGLTGSYYFTNPNVYDGFRTRFGGNMSIGVALTVPLWQWNEQKHHIQAAKLQVHSANMLFKDTQEKITLQVNQAKFKNEEAAKQLLTTQSNLKKADENLHCAEIGFQEGVIPLSDLLEAQTAQLEAKSGVIDAIIETKLTEVSLKKALGSLTINP